MALRHQPALQRWFWFAPAFSVPALQAPAGRRRGAPDCGDEAEGGSFGGGGVSRGGVVPKIGACACALLHTYGATPFWFA
eukprot:9197853-Lingulodinium_polyedra.AAC.1